MGSIDAVILALRLRCPLSLIVDAAVGRTLSDPTASPRQQKKSWNYRDGVFICFDGGGGGGGGFNLGGGAVGVLEGF